MLSITIVIICHIWIIYNQILS